MLFDHATDKLQDARIALERLKLMVIPIRSSSVRFVSGAAGTAGDEVGIKEPFAFAKAFSSCVIQIRSIGDAILEITKLQEKKNELQQKNLFASFESWSKTKVTSLKNDELMAFINDTKNSSFHNGIIPLVFTTYGHQFSKPFMVANGKGISQVIHPGTPEEQRVPIELNDGCTFGVGIINPPSSHQGKLLPATDPITICSTALTFYANLLFEVKNMFGN